MATALEFMSRPAIDIHGHCGSYAGYPAFKASLLNAPAQVTAQRARACGIVTTVVSELSTFDVDDHTPSDVDAGNAMATEAVEQYDNLLFWAVVNPKRDDWETKADKLLAHQRCAGVKLHPRWHYWSVADARYSDRLFAFLHDRGTLTMTHSGNAGNEPHRFIPWANKYPNARLILAHIGNDHIDGRPDTQTNAVGMAEQGNVWTDTSSSNSIVARIIEKAVEAIGAERILFGTDTPLYFAATQKARIAYAEIDDDAKQKILHDNAAALLGDAQQR